MSAVFLLLVGCAEVELPLAPEMVVTIDGLYHVGLSPDPDPPVAGDVLLELDISDGEAPVTGATVTVDPFMPDMGHGITGEVTVTELGDGLYEASWAYSMPGYWELTLTIDGEPGLDETVVAYDVQ